MFFINSAVDFNKNLNNPAIQRNDSRRTKEVALMGYTDKMVEAETSWIKRIIQSERGLIDARLASYLA